MLFPPPSQVQHIAIIGTGVIGSGWAAHFLRNGMDVTAYDPAPDTESKLRQKIETVWPTLARLGLRPNASPDRLRFVHSLEEAVTDAEFIQENTPERLPVKIATLTAIDAAAPPDSLIASSTSGYGMTEMAVNVRHPERCVVAHPFNPPYLMPAVEVVAGKKTSPEAHQWAVDFYRATGKQPLKLTKETPGFVADRIMEAVWREILHMINHDMATVEEIDMSVRYGPGLRWAMMGPLTVLHLGGGAGGMAHLIHQFGPSLQSPWTFLGAPELTDDLVQKVIEGCERLTEGIPIHELEAERDDLLIQMLERLDKSRLWHIGNRHVKRTKWQPSPEPPRWRAGDPIAAPLDLYHCTVDPEWIDYNGHMTEAAYLTAFGWASDAIFHYIGIDDSYRASGNSYYTVETHLNYYRECSTGDPLRFTTQILDIDDKRLHLFHHMYHATSGELLCTTEQMLLHVDMHASRSSPARPHVLEALAAIMEIHRILPIPLEVGRQMAIRKKN
ncbi:MAG TPA: 3-hydroxyacyl-CoA dehydrogenase NAD-binding domain-containing protein [Anaerolineales bacterium]|nr:3-hydroxyacyl-CoA dehydrogenase NAD-binding domain-containing protein [Anaerolineales bacterium]